MDKRYYLDYYEAERKHWFFKSRNAIILQHISSLFDEGAADLKILNVGVATGHTSELLNEIGEVTSLEFDDDCCAFLNEELPELEVVQGSVLELPFDDNSFDLVCAFDVIEHVEDDTLAADELKRVCSPNGHVVLTVPAFMSLWSQHDDINHHFRRYRKGRIKSLLSEGGKTNYLTYFNFFLFPPVFVFRRLSSLLRGSKTASTETAGSDLDHFKGDSLISRCLYRILLSEKLLVSWRLVLPFGVSILASWKKESER